MQESKNESVEEVVADAVRYYRYRGASLQTIDSYVHCRANSQNYAAKRSAAVSELERQQRIEKRGNLWYLHPSEFNLARGDSYAPEFEEMDFCILLAIVGVGTDCDLQKLIGTTDFIMRALPDFGAIYGGLNRLHAARLIGHKQVRFSATPKANDLFAAAKSKAKNAIYDQLDALKRLVLCPCCGAVLKRVSWRIALPESEFKAAVRQYART